MSDVLRGRRRVELQTIDSSTSHKVSETDYFMVRIDFSFHIHVCMY